MRAAARAAFAERDDRSVVADLVYDSVVDGPPEALAAERVLRFEAPGRRIELTVRPTGGALTVAVAVQPPAPLPVTARGERGSWRAESDAAGRAEFTGLPPSLLTFTVCVPEPGRPVRTAWVRL